MRINMSLPIKLASLGLLAAAVSQSLYAQSDIETIVVTGARTPIQKQHLSGTVNIIDSEQITASQAQDVAELLRGMAGISISQSGGRGSLNELRVRGTESNHILVLIDGVEINDLGQGGLANFAHINLENIDRIEILKGAQSALWGSGAVGGVINIISKTGQTERGTSLRLELGDASSRRISASSQNRVGDVNYSVSVSHSETDGQNISLQGNEDDGYENSQLHANADWRISATQSLKVNLRYQDARNDFDSFGPSDADNHTNVKQLGGKLVWQHQPTNTNWDQQIGLHFNQNDNTSYTEGDFNSATDSERLKLFWQGQLAYSDNGSLTVALEHLSEDFEQRGLVSFFGDPNQQQNNHINSVVADVLHHLTQSISLTTSIRHDANSEFDDATTYRAGLTYRSSEQVKWFVSYGTAVKNPTFTEIFGFVPASFVGNLNLQPERAKTWEVGSQFKLSEIWELELSYYDSTLEDEIQTVFGNEFSSSTNLPFESARKGAELSVNGDLGALRLTFDYGYVDAEQPGFFGSLVKEPRRAQNTAKLSANYSFLDEKANLYLQASYQGEQLDTDFSTFTEVELGGYTLINLAFNYWVQADWQLYLRADNLFDKTYQDVVGFQGQQRRVYLGTRYRF